MRILLATWLVAGCSFEHGLLEHPPDSGPPADPTVDAPAGTARTCKYPDPALRLCIEFDDRNFTPIAFDASPYGLDAAATAIAEYTRNDTPAAATSWSSQIRVRETPMLDISPAITFELWVRVPAYGWGAGLIWNDGQYQMWLDREGRVSCRVGNVTATTSSELGTNKWRHVACAFDGQGSKQLTLYIDGVAEQCKSASGAIPASGAQGTSIAGNLVGAIDDIRIYARRLAASEICSHADKTSCTARCEDE